MTRQEIINVASAVVLVITFWATVVIFLVRALGAQGFVILVVGVCMGLMLGLGAWGAWDRHRKDKEMDARREAHHAARRAEADREWAELEQAMLTPFIEQHNRDLTDLAKVTELPTKPPIRHVDTVESEESVTERARRIRDANPGIFNRLRDL